MRQCTRFFPLLVACAGLLAACDEKPQARKGDDELTIVVEADKTRIAAEEAKLNEQRKTIDAERDRLRKELEKLDAVKGEKAGDPQSAELLRQAIRLVREQEEMAAKRDALARERDGLLQKVIADPAARVAAAPERAGGSVAAAAAASAELAKVSGQVVGREKDLASRERTLAEREAALAERERGLAQRESDFAKRDSACAAAPARVQAGPGLNKGAVERAYKAVLGAMASKGLLASDLPAAKQKALRDAANFQKGDLAQALESVEQVEAAVNGISIDGAFVSEKAKRVDALQRQVRKPGVKDEVNRLLQDMTRAYSDGRYAEANRALNNIVHLLEKP